ncbi:MAG: ABC transporter permease [Desulfurobacteriaceae bacterium]
MGEHELLIVLFAYFLILATVFFDIKNGIGFWKDLLFSSFLSIIQLVGVGFVILFLLDLKQELINLLLTILFFVNASLITLRRFQFTSYSKFKVFLTILFSISIISTISLFVLYTVGILTLKANSIIPLAGIIAASGMRSLSLSFSYYKRRLKDVEDLILGMAALGANSVEIFKPIFRELILDITTPVRDMFRSSGIVHIPGVMVGLLIAGVLPLKAAVIQFAILSTMIFQFTFVPAIAFYTLIKLYGIKIEG